MSRHPNCRPHRSVYNRNRLRKLAGLPEEQRGRWGYASSPDYVNPFADWHDKRKPGAELCDRVFVAWLLTKDIPLSVKIANRADSMDDVIQHAKAAAVLMEVNDVQT